MKGWATEVREDKEVFADLAEWWDHRTVVRANPFLSTGVLRCWVDGIDEPSSRIRVFLLHRDGELVAALPLYLARGRHRSLHKEHTEPFDVIRVDDPVVDEYLPIWLDRLPVTHLYRVPASSPVVGAVGGKRRWHVQKVFKTPYVDLSEGFDAVLADMSKEQVRANRRRRRRLEERGDVRFVLHPSREEVGSSLKAGLELQMLGWKGERGHAELSDPVHERWYRSLAEVAEDAGWLRVSSLYLDDRLLSFNLGVWVDDVAYGMLNAYDESDDVRSLSTGNLMFQELFAHAASDGIRRYDLGSGDDPWKLQWTAKSHDLYDLLLFGSGVRGRVMDFARNRLRRPGTGSKTGDGRGPDQPGEE